MKNNEHDDGPQLPTDAGNYMEELNSALQAIGFAETAVKQPQDVSKGARSSENYLAPVRGILVNFLEKLSPSKSNANPFTKSPKIVSETFPPLAPLQYPLLDDKEARAKRDGGHPIYRTPPTNATRKGANSKSLVFWREPPAWEIKQYFEDLKKEKNNGK